MSKLYYSPERNRLMEIVSINITCGHYIIQTADKIVPCWDIAGDIETIFPDYILIGDL